MISLIQDKSFFYFTTHKLVSFDHQKQKIILFHIFVSDSPTNNSTLPKNTNTNLLI